LKERIEELLRKVISARNVGCPPVTCRAAFVNGWRWPARCCTARVCFFWMSRRPGSIRATPGFWRLIRELSGMGTTIS